MKESTVTVSHTPVPWNTTMYGSVVAEGMTGRDCIEVEGFAFSGSELAIANHKFIIRAVNSHADLLAACKRSLELRRLTGDGVPITVQSVVNIQALSAEYWAMVEAAVAKTEGTV